MSVDYTVYLGPYFLCTKESYKNWVMNDIYKDFDTVELERRQGVAFVPYMCGVYLSIDDTKAINISSLPNEEITRLNDKYKDILPLFPDGITAHYGLVTWWS